MSRSTPEVARALLGQRLVRHFPHGVFVGQIVETEAYGGREDSTSHARGGPTGRAAPMYGPVGHAYIYLIYGQYSCLNVVAHQPGMVGAVLIRALAPEEGFEHLTLPANPRTQSQATSGPGRLTRALELDRNWTNAWLLDPMAPLFLAEGSTPHPDEIVAGPRIGVVGTAADCAEAWRFTIAGNPYVSRGSTTQPKSQRPEV